LPDRAAYTPGRREDVSNEPQAAPLGVVLFVDGDHADHVEALRLAGYVVEVAPSALEALRRGDSLRPDALIVPLALPEMEGADLAHRIGSTGVRVHTLAVVILVPADGGARRAAGVLAAGAVFCNLPCDPAELVATVAKQLAARRILDGPAS
jgi:DNA-binding response OmpR family regulator